jgi:hypothetical protein
MSTSFCIGTDQFLNATTGEIDDSRYENELFGYGNNHTVRKGPASFGHQVSMNGSEGGI